MKTRLYLVLLIFFTISYICIVQHSIFIDYNKEPEVLGWERHKSRNISKYLSQIPESAFLRPACNIKTFLKIFVVSDVRNFERRKIIRDTWGNEQKFGYHAFEGIHRQTKGRYLNISDRWKRKDFKITFVLGKSRPEYQEKLIEEAKMYKDVLQEDFYEHYSNLTLKTLCILKWATIEKNSKFFVKVDDDIFLNVPNLMQILLGGTIPAYKALKYFYNDKTIDVTNAENRLNSNKNLLMGDLWVLTPSLRNPRLKHYAPRYLYEPAFYPPFLSGYSFVMSAHTASLLYKEALKTPFFHLEDVFVTGIVAQKAGVPRKRHHLYSFKRLTDMCGLKGIVAENGRDPREFQQALDFVLDEKVECQTLTGKGTLFLYKIIYTIFEPWISIWNNYKYWLPPKRN